MAKPEGLKSGGIMNDYLVGVDIGGTMIKIGCFNTDGVLIKKWSFPTRTIDNGERILNDVAISIDSNLNEEHITIENVMGIGIGVPGPIIKDSIVNKCVNLGWGIKDVAAELSSLINIRNIKVANDANAAALGEAWKGAGEGKHSAVLITIGTGIGAGVIIDESIVSGAFGSAGEIGHIIVNEDETVACTCGNKGCLEQYASATGVVRACKNILALTDTQSVLRDVPDISCKEIFDAARNNDPLAVKIVDDVCRNIGKVLSYVSAVVNPEIFIIGGGVSKAGSILLNGIQGYFRHYAFHASRRTRFRLAELGNDAGIYGLARLAMNEVTLHSDKKELK